MPVPNLQKRSRNLITAQFSKRIADPQCYIKLVAKNNMPLSQFHISSLNIQAHTNKLSLYVALPE